MHEKRYTELQHSKFTKSLFLANKCQQLVIIMFQMKNRTEWTFEFDKTAFRNLLKDGCRKNNVFLTSKVSKGATIRNRYNQVPHPTQDTNGKATNPHQDIAGPRSAVGNVSGYRCVSDCRSRGREFDPGPVPYFRRD